MEQRKEFRQETLWLTLIVVVVVSVCPSSAQPSFGSIIPRVGEWALIHSEFGFPHNHPLAPVWHRPNRGRTLLDYRAKMWCDARDAEQRVAARLQQPQARIAVAQVPADIGKPVFRPREARPSFLPIFRSHPSPPGPPPPRYRFQRLESPVESTPDTETPHLSPSSDGSFHTAVSGASPYRPEATTTQRLYPSLPQVTGRTPINFTPPPERLYPALPNVVSADLVPPPHQRPTQLGPLQGPQTPPPQPRPNGNWLRLELSTTPPAPANPGAQPQPDPHNPPPGSGAAVAPPVHPGFFPANPLPHSAHTSPAVVAPRSPVAGLDLGRQPVPNNSDLIIFSPGVPPAPAPLPPHSPVANPSAPGAVTDGIAPHWAIMHPVWIPA